MSKQKFSPNGDVAMRPESVGLVWPRAPVHADGDDWRQPNVQDGVAVIKICGPLEHSGGWWFDSYEKILGRIEGAMLDEDVHAVVLDIDSPGGEVSGLQETVRKILRMREDHGKPVIAYADDEAYSAAYALACSADEIYMPESGGVGSIGVIAELQNMQGAADKAGVQIEVIRSGTRKAEGHPFLPITDDVKAHVQERVDGLAKQFFALVADARPIARKDLAALEGQCVYGKRAVTLGLADGIASFDEVLSGLSSGRFDNTLDSAVSSTPNDRSIGKRAMAFEILRKKVAAAAAALEAAKTPAAKKKAMAVYAAAAEALADARAKSKVKKTYNKKTVEEETEEDDGEEDDEDDDDDDDDDDSSSDAVGAAAEEEDEENEEDEKKMKKGKKSKASSSIAAFVKSLTGQSSDKAAREVLVSMHETALAAQQATERIAALEAAALASDRKSLITSMMGAGQLKPAQISWAETQSIRSLKAYQKATPAMFAPRTPPMQNSEPDSDGGGGDARDVDGLTAFERKLCAEQNIKPESYKAQRDGASAPSLPKVN